MRPTEHDVRQPITFHRPMQRGTEEIALVKPVKIPVVMIRQYAKSSSDPTNQNAKAVAMRGTKSDSAVIPLENYHDVNLSTYTGPPRTAHESWLMEAGKN